jgi:predicted nucleic acid-binding protein
MLRAVLDTNLIVSSIIRKKMCLLLSHAWHETRFALIASENIIEEVQRVLSAPKMKDTFHLTQALIARFLETLRADVIVSDDKYLLNLDKFKNVPILKPREFLDRPEQETHE